MFEGESSRIGRRQFAMAAAGSLAMLGMAGADRALGANSPGFVQPSQPSAKAEVALVFCDEVSASGKRIQLVETVLTRACPRIKFTVATVHNPGEARDVVSHTAGVDGYLVWAFGSRHGSESAQVFIGSSKPVVLALDGAGRAA